MSTTLRPATPSDIPALQHVALRVFEPIFASVRAWLGPTVYPVVYPDWRATQRDLVASLVHDTACHTVVAISGAALVGLVAYRNDHATKTGEIELLMVAPAAQRQGLGTRLNTHALDAMRADGMIVASLSTGGDPSHAPARRGYEKVGFKAWPNVWYFKALDDDEAG